MHKCTAITSAPNSKVWHKEMSTVTEVVRIYLPGGTWDCTAVLQKWKLKAWCNGADW